MILLGRHRFSVSRFHAEHYPDTADSALARGPVVRLGLRFERWLGGRRIEADAFVDPGADETILSLRWIQEQGGKGSQARPRTTLPDPRERHHYLLDEGATVEIAGRTLALGTTRPVRVLPQPPMSGFEDMLLGRDFLAAHGLLFVLDGQEETFSMLLPEDEDNRQRRRRILAELSEPPG
ncbi:hypothetical protein BE08_36285 [Sorangium cellulosum]|uniref:Peptidase A2 domain-containing protein n=1 Tax=Sorangium cellulosum TaxID=56 RepID=A0A150PH96_SORCE|nr:hypothetical protein BE08_36285 [Sorangium cellulosum]